MPEIIKREWRNHPLGTTLVVITCISFLIGGVSWTYGKGAEHSEAARDIKEAKQTIQAVAKELKDHIDDAAAHPDYQKQAEQFVTRREYSDTIISIKNGQTELKADMQEQRKLSIEILQRLPPKP